MEDESARGKEHMGWEVEDGDDGVTRLGNSSRHGVVEGGQSREASGLVREPSHEEALRILFCLRARESIVGVQFDQLKKIIPIQPISVDPNGKKKRTSTIIAWRKGC